MPPGSEQQQCAAEKDFLTSPGVKRTDILRREQVNRKSEENRLAPSLLVNSVRRAQLSKILDTAAKPA
jgi:hypothetical protein